jgi:hypothetical protein
MRSLLQFSLFAASVVVGAVPGFAQISSRFDSGFDGWAPVFFGFSWETQGGNPGGYIRFQESGNPPFSSLIAPAQYLGNWSALDGVGFFRYDFRLFSGTPDRTAGLLVSGPGGSMFWRQPLHVGLNGWQTVSAPICEANWEISTGVWNNILNNVTEVRLAPDYFDHFAEITGVDNITILPDRGDDHWDTRFSAHGLPWGVRAVVSRGNEVFVGGGFTHIGNVPARNLARWDGRNWSEVGGGVNGVVNCLAVGGGNLYVGGQLNEAGGVEVFGAAKWDGTNWTALGYLSPNAMAATDTEVYASNGTSGGPFGPYIMRWNGTNWEALGGGFYGGFCIEVSEPVQAIAASGKDVYIGGGFTAFGNVTNLAKWDGTNWSAVGGGVHLAAGFGACYPVQTLTFHDGFLYVGGQFNRLGDVNVTNANIARWDGTNWFAFHGGVGDVNGQVNAIAVSGANVYVAGRFTHAAGGVAAANIARWNGARWLPLGGGIDGEYPSVATLATDTNGDLFVGGSFTTAGGYACTNLAIWSRIVAQPTLEISRTDTQYVLTWPGDFSNFILEQSLEISGPWSLIPENAALLENRWTLTKTFESGSRYFRLARLRPVP